MTNIEVATTTGREVALNETVIEEFSAGLRGDLLRPGDDGYDDARTNFNAMIDNRPALIARCAGVADVIHAVDFARTNDLLTSVRGGRWSDD
jgi:hypothetical protein